MAMELTQRELRLEGLCCTHCAARIERNVAGLDGVHSATVDFATATLRVEIAGEALADAILTHAGEIARRQKHEDESQPGSGTLRLGGLTCAHCAGKIEAAVADLPGVAAARLDFLAQTLTVEVADRARLRDALAQAEATAHRIEDGLTIEVLPADAGHGRGIEMGGAACDTCTDHGHVHDEADAPGLSVVSVAPILVSVVFFALGMLLPFPGWGKLIVFLVSYLLAGGPVLWSAVRSIWRGQVFDENFLMAVASLGAFAIGESPEGAAVMLFYRVGEFFQDLAVDRSRRSVRALMDIRPDTANLLVNGEPRVVAPEEVTVGDLLLVRPGERVPLDGVVRQGSSALDTSALTGESAPRDVAPGDEILSGSINQSGLLTVEVTRPFGQSTVSRILEMVQNATGKKAKTEQFITRFARWYTPAVVGAAVLLALVPPLVVPGAAFAEWINRALVFLVVSCPCALVLSIPLSFFGGIGGASRQGILIKGSNHLEALKRVDTVVFDKTGTLTEGRFAVTETVPANGWTAEGLLEWAAHAESHSNHPIAQSIRAAWRQAVDMGRVTAYEDVAGQGVRATIDGRTVLAGNRRLLGEAGIDVAEPLATGTVVHLAADGGYSGYLVIADRVKDDSAAAVAALRAQGVRRVVMLTGDRQETGETVGRAVGVDRVVSGLLPHQKVEELERLMADRPRGAGSVVFVGYGINDAPVLARADVGVAMGGLGADAAIEAADVVLMTDEPTKLAAALRQARRTRAIVVQNIVFALGIKGILLLLGALGMANMWEAVFGDVGVALIAILNAMRLLRK